MITDVYLNRRGQVIAFYGAEFLYIAKIEDKLEELKAEEGEIRWHVGNFGSGVRGCCKAEFVRVAGEMIEKGGQKVGS